MLKAYARIIKLLQEKSLAIFLQLQIRVARILQNSNPTLKKRKPCSVHQRKEYINLSIYTF